MAATEWLEIKEYLSVVIFQISIGWITHMIQCNIKTWPIKINGEAKGLSQHSICNRVKPRNEHIIV
jgi:hypothetical protein